MKEETTPAGRYDTQSSQQGTAPHSDVRRTSEHHANLSAVLAGFAFTAIILVVQETQSSHSQDFSALLSQATASFLMALIGCLTCAVLFAVIASDREMVARPRGVFFLTSMIAFISGSHIFYALNCLLAVYLPHLVYLSRWVLIFIALSAIAHLVNIEIGLAWYDPAPRTRRELVLFAAPGFAIVGMASVLSLTHTVRAERLAAIGFPVALACSLLLMGLGSIWALVVNGQDGHYRLPSTVTAGWIVACALLFSLMILTS